VEILQQIIDKVTVRWRDDAFEIELIGEIANMVAFSSQDSTTATSGFRRSVKVVGGQSLANLSPSEIP
jgi:hypothetical protein